jgi:hypothetical protein
MRQHASAYASIRQHTSAYVSIRQHTPGVDKRSAAHADALEAPYLRQYLYFCASIKQVHCIPRFRGPRCMRLQVSKALCCYLNLYAGIYTSMLLTTAGI